MKNLFKRFKSAPSQPVTRSSDVRASQPTTPPTKVKTSSKTFAELGLTPELCQTVKDEGYTTPTAIQLAAIPEVLRGRDLLGTAQTGTGKTAAFSLPMLQLLSAQPDPKHHIRALILTPTRELAIQIGDSLKTYGRGLKLRSTVIFGGVGAEPQKQALRHGVDIVVATPGRLLDLMNQRCVDLNHINIFVLDEADRMLDMGFIHDVKRIIAKLPKQRQNLLFSATMPQEVANLTKEILKNPAHVEVTPVSSTTAQVKQQIYFVDRGHKRDLLLHILNQDAVVRALIFARTKANANRVAEFVNKSGISAEAIHGNKSQSARQRALEMFRSGKIAVLVASDIAARGLDIDEISHVINYDMTHEPETYVHRIGRTGRAEARGVAMSFVDAEERGFLREVERVTGQKIPVVDDHPFPAQEKERAPAPRQQHGRRPQRSAGAKKPGHGQQRQQPGQHSNQNRRPRPKSKGSRPTSH